MLQTNTKAARGFPVFHPDRIDYCRLKTLLQGHAWRRAAVIASISGGWFVRRLEVAV